VGALSVSDATIGMGIVSVNNDCAASVWWVLDGHALPYYIGKITEKDHCHMVSISEYLYAERADKWARVTDFRLGIASLS
jgi:hypothetical protein